MGQRVLDRQIEGKSERREKKKMRKTVKQTKKERKKNENIKGLVASKKENKTRSHQKKI